MKEIFNALYEIISRADFYYPMIDGDERPARRRFHEDRDRYFRLCESSDLTEQEREDFINLWTEKSGYCSANMCGNSEYKKEHADKYNKIFDKYFSEA